MFTLKFEWKQSSLKKATHLWRP